MPLDANEQWFRENGWAEPTAGETEIEPPPATGVRSVRAVRDGSARETAPNAPNVPNAHPREAGQLWQELARFVRRFVVLSEPQADAVALWVLHTHALDAADTTPYLAITSAEKRSGKTRLLEVLELLVREPLPTANISDAALFRAVAELSPTLLLDEVDAIFGAKARDREDLRGMLNAGYRRGNSVLRMGGAKMTTLEAFPVFCTKVFAGIGRLPDTIEDRSIRIRLERKTRDETAERFRRREVEAEAGALKERAAAWAEPSIDWLIDARPLLPDELDDRAQDVWEPLLAIAELAGDEPAIRARAAAVALSSGAGRDDDSLGVRLLADIRRVLDDRGTDRIKTSELLWALAAIETSPWGNWYGKQLSAHGLSKLLQGFHIKTMPVWVDGETVRGYKREQFQDAWSRYLPDAAVSGVRAVRAGLPDEAPPNAPNAPNAQGTPQLTDEEVEREFVRFYPEANGATPEQKRDLVLACLAAEAHSQQQHAPEGAAT